MIKTIVFLFIFLYCVPFFTFLCYTYPTMRKIFFVAMVYFTSYAVMLHIHPMPNWTGSSRGYAFNMVSFFAMPLVLSTILHPRMKFSLFPPGSFCYLLYFAAIVISGKNAIHKAPWGFEVVKMFWMYVTFLAAYNFMFNCKDLSIFVYSVAGTILIIFLIGMNQKYRQGLWQIRSTFSHQNSLSLYLELFGLLCLGVLMNEKTGKMMFIASGMGIAMSAVLIISTYSRGGLVVFFGGIAVVCGLSLLINGLSTKRLVLLLCGLVVVISILAYAAPRIIIRFTKAPEASKMTRVNLAIAAKRIADDFTLGIGANNFTEYSGPFRKYAVEQHANLRITEDTSGRGGIVETIYLLVAAECGWWGLGTLLLWFLYYYFVDLRTIFVLKKMPCSGLAIGMFGGMTCIYLHSTMEWSLKQYNNFAELMIIFALIGVLAKKRKSIIAAYQNSLKAEAVIRPKKKKAPDHLPFPKPPHPEALPS